MTITYAVVCPGGGGYRSAPHATIDKAIAQRNAWDRLTTCGHLHHIHSIIDGTDAPCSTCEPVLPNLLKGDHRTVCCDALTFDHNGTAHCSVCRRPITGRL